MKLSFLSYESDIDFWAEMSFCISSMDLSPDAAEVPCLFCMAPIHVTLASFMQVILSEC